MTKKVKRPTIEDVLAAAKRNRERADAPAKPRARRRPRGWSVSN